MARMPNLNSEGQKELDRAEKQFQEFDQNVKDLTFDRMNAAPVQESEPQTKISQEYIKKSTDTYLKPIKIVSSSDKFNEKFRDRYEYDKKYVKFTAQHNEIIGDDIDIWTRPYGGMPAEEWKVPTNKPVWGPRYLAEQIKRCRYARLVMEESRNTGRDGIGQWFGAMAVDTKVQRLDAFPVSESETVFMGARNF